MIISRFFKFGYKKAALKGLGVAELPLDVYRGKQPMKSNDFKKFVNEYFFPAISQLGFKGKDFFFFREKELYTEIVFFWTYKTGGAIQVDLLVKFNNINYPDGNVQIKTEKLRPQDCEFQKRLSPYINFSNNAPKTWFWLFHEEPDENKSIVIDIKRLFLEYGVDYFKKFENPQNYLNQINSKNYLRFLDFFINMVAGRGESGILFFLFDFWRQNGVKEKALEFAKIGLKRLKANEHGNYRQIFVQFQDENRN